MENLSMKNHAALFLALSVTLVGCQQSPVKPSVLTTLFPYFSIADELIGDQVDVKFLLNPGVEAHDFSPTPSQVVDLQNADLIMYTNDEFDPWLQGHTATIPAINKIAIADWIELIDYEEDHEGEEEEHDEDEEDHEHEEDPHFWIDPQLGMEMVTVISNRLILVFPQFETLLQERSQVLIDEEFIPLVEGYESFADTQSFQEFIFAGHNAFRYLINYNVEFISPFPGFTSATNLSPNDLLTFIHHLERLQSTTIFAAETEDPLIAELASEYARIQGVTLTIQTLYVMENITSEQQQSAITYQDLLALNLEGLRA